MRREARRAGRLAETVLAARGSHALATGRTRGVCSKYKPR